MILRSGALRGEKGVSRKRLASLVGVVRAREMHGPVWGTQHDHSRDAALFDEVEADGDQVVGERLRIDSRRLGFEDQVIGAE